MSHRQALEVDTISEQRTRLEAARDDALRRGAHDEARRAQQELDILDAARATEDRLKQRSAEMVREEQARAERERAEQATQAKRERLGALMGEARTLAASAQGRWERERIIAAEDLARLVAVCREHYALSLQRSALVAGERCAEWAMCRLGEVIEYPAPYPIERRRRTLTLAQMLGLDSLDAPTEAR